ncbi:hypothetical protein LBMAG42_02040 [Deltaproteobacteria bacterium]|nr:hypothetical protein LBMAG42_02040 [Deltaproteobacteria bacterium]
MGAETPSRASLASYTGAARAVDSAAILGFFAAAGANVSRVWALGMEALDGATAAAICLGYLASDLGSGTVHWFFDTWLSARTPVLGSMFVRPFREHHVDPKAITRHDFVETNGSNCLATAPVLLGALLLDPSSSIAAQFGVVFLVALALGVFATNQLHKWAHADEVPPGVRWLQCMGLVLRPEHHSVHHRAPFARHYCITTGWMNPLLDGLGYFRSLERAISALTRAVPRAEDAAIT